ncbi:MAG: type II secretion system GspH family protein [Phycisphaerales bacterium]|nr:type II secretion system GspH family protein [Phycisphaerales bacterium]
MIRSRRCRAFTVLELLIVITVIAILIALSLVALRGSLQRTNEVRCLANLRQQLVGLSILRSQQNDLLPIIPVEFDTAGKPKSLWKEFQRDWCEALGQDPIRAVDGVFDSFGNQVWSVGPPWKCPGDRPGTRDDQFDPAYSVAEVQQSSYPYWPALYALNARLRRVEHRDIQRLVTRHWDTDPREEVLRDQNWFHSNGTRTFANYGFIDGSAGAARLSPEASREWVLRLVEARNSLQGKAPPRQ